MNTDEITKIAKDVAAGLDLSKLGGDLVLFKYVEQETNIAEGGIGVQNNYYYGAQSEPMTEQGLRNTEETQQKKGVDAVRPLLDKVVEAENELKRDRLRKVVDAMLKEELFIEAFKIVAPRGFKDGYNQKLLASTLGYLHTRGVCSLPYSHIEPIVSPGKSIKTYFVNCTIEESGMTDELLQKLKTIMG